MNSISGLYVSWDRILRSFLKVGTVVAALAAGVIPAWAQSNLGDSDRWVRVADRSQQRIEHQAVTLKNGKVMVMGGYDVEALDILFGNGQGSALESVEIYDRESNMWSPAARMPQPAGWQWAAVLKNGQVLVAGSFDPHNGNVGTFSAIYNPKTNAWSPTAPPPVGVSNPHAYERAIVLKDARVLIAGGGDSNSAGPSNIALIYTPDPSNAALGSWDYTRNHKTGGITKLHVGRTTGAFVKLNDGRVLYAGGFAGPDFGDTVTSAAADLFDPATGEWTTLPDMPAIPGEVNAEGQPLDDGNTINPGSRIAPIGEPLPGNRALVAGGLLCRVDFGYCGRRRSALIFDPKNLASPWKIISPMIHRRWFSLSAILDEERRVLVAGGGSDPTTAEIFDPESGAWSPAASFPSIDAFGSQLSRTGEELLLTGGFDYDISPPNGVPQLGSVKSFLYIQGDLSGADSPRKSSESQDEGQKLIGRARKMGFRTK